MTIAIDIAQIASPILYAAFIVVIYFQLRSARASVQEVRQEFLAGGRPVVAVHDEYDTATRAVNLVVENVGQGPAKDIAFAFSRPIESSDGVVLSGLALFTAGLTSLSPAARITCYWDDFDDLMASLRAQGLGGSDVEVTVTYCDLTGATYSNEWDIQPGIYEGLRSRPSEEKTAAGDAARSDVDREEAREPTSGAAGGPVSALTGAARPASDGSSSGANSP